VIPGPRFLCLAVLAAALLAAPARGRCDDAPAARKPFAFASGRRERCDYFLVTEFTMSRTGGSSSVDFDRMLFTDSFGVMRNIDDSRAVGLSVDAELAEGAIRLVPTLRLKQWFAGRQSVDVLVGYAGGSLTQEGVIGTVADVRYSPTPWFHVQAGGSRIRSVSSIVYDPDYHVTEQHPFRMHVGAWLGGAPGAVTWGLQAIAFAGLLFAFRNAD